MHGKRRFPWPQEMPELTLHEKSKERLLRITWRDQTPVSASIHTHDRNMGVRLDSLLKAGSGIATLLRQRHHEGSLTIQLHDEDPLYVLTRQAMTSTTRVAR